MPHYSHCLAEDDGGDLGSKVTHMGKKDELILPDATHADLDGMEIPVAALESVFPVPE